jgi:hypothetical protein
VVPHPLEQEEHMAPSQSTPVSSQSCTPLEQCPVQPTSQALPQAVLQVGSI